MVTVQLTGGLGNQMFQYAAGAALARRHGVPLCLDLSELAHDRLRDYMLDRYRLSDTVEIGDQTTPFIMLRLARLVSFGGLYVEPHYHFDPGFLNCGRDSRLYGYFQSERYFDGMAETLRDHFALKEPLSSSAASLSQKIEQAPVSVSLHVRRGDYVSDETTRKVHGSVGDDYYRRAVALMSRLHGDKAVFFIFSDDPDYADKAFSFFPDRHVVRGSDSPHEDMHLMARCNHHIIANSSFSWWGAWLNPDPEKIVIAPRLWFARDTQLKKNTVDLYPQGWITL